MFEEQILAQMLPFIQYTQSGKFNTEKKKQKTKTRHLRSLDSVREGIRSRLERQPTIEFARLLFSFD